ncbi:MAG TPA: FAD-dependent oxidoreductase, partial [Thermomicrobiales bacterium]|nr:FAD-dependent oxidoreductase [Thermomicrobiales bacterium]
EASIIANQEEAIALIPDVVRAVIDQAWIGIDNHGHDDVPVLGLVDGVEGLVIATGFSGHGFALAPAVGEAIAGLITTGTSPIEIDLLSLSRFTEATDASTTDHAG